ncbi:outer membrane lipid asymmetry maintenance protein MlaD [Candidatus Rariloculus sp.]|uniref:outer membrane lipid asymmetry maintenance protein MlaD n=1 Tax=Candidatus Rariloculus sp. TaxID=3101265 RepID=UPI003D0D8462
MRNTRTIELGTGLFVLLGILSLLFLTTQTSNLETYFNDGYTVTARFDNVGGLAVRAPVTMAGVTIGRVAAIAFDPDQFKAVVNLRIDPQYTEIPEDSDASILTSGLLGGQYVGLNPGGSLDSLGDGSEIQFTQSAIVLEDLVGRFLLSVGEE